MSSALTGNKIKDSYQALLKMGTNGSLDPITAITISDGLGNDTPLQLSATLFKTKVVSANKDYGLQLDLSANSHVYLGDYNTQYNGTSLYLSDFNQLIQTYGLGSQSIGLKLDFANSTFSFGDFNLVNNGTSLIIDDNARTIYTYDNGSVIGLNINFASNYYEFGDATNITGKSSYLSLSSIASEASAIISITGNALNIKEYGNIWGGAQGQMDYFDAIYDNFGFTFDWTIDNDDIGLFPFYKNTIINTFGAVLTKELAMNNNFFANNSQLELAPNINFSNNEVLSNCFVFGLTENLGSNALTLFSRVASSFNTNAVIFNGSAITIGKGSNHIFSVNASGLNFAKDVSGITVLGGDVYSQNSSIYVTAQHSVSDGKCGINFTGHHAKGTNNLSNVFGYYNVAFGTAIGQVQIEQKQLFANCPDGTGYYNLVDTFENEIIFVENNTTYLLEVKVVSTNGNGNTGSSGNWTYYEQYIICVDGSGTLSASNQVINSFGYNPPDQEFKLFANANEFYFQVRPDNANGVHCWVRAEIVLHKIKAV